MNPRLKSFLSVTLKLSISGGLIFWLVATDKLPLSELDLLLEPRVVIWGLFWLGGTFFVASERWRLLLNYQGIPATNIQCFKLTLVGLFFGFFLPGGVGGDLVKAFYVSQNQEGKKSMAIGSVVFDRLVGLFSMSIFCLVAVALAGPEMLSNEKIQPLIFLVFIMFSVFFILFLSLWSRRFSKLRAQLVEISAKLPIAKKSLEGVFRFKLTRSQFFKVVGLSLLTQACNMIFFMGIPFFLGQGDLPLLPLLFAIPLGFIATAIPISPGGVGVGQAAFFFLYTLVLQQPTNLGSLSVTLFQAFSILYGLLGAVIYLGLGRHKRILVA